MRVTTKLIRVIPVKKLDTTVKLQVWVNDKIYFADIWQVEEYAHCIAVQYINPVTRNVSKMLIDKDVIVTVIPKADSLVEEVK